MKPVKGRMKDKRVGMTFVIDKELHKVLQHHSIDIEISVSDMLREGLQLYMDKHGIVVRENAVKAVK